MKATISLDASDLLKIARLVHDKAPNKNEPFSVDYESAGITLVIDLLVDYFDSEDGVFEVIDIGAFIKEDIRIVPVDLDIPHSIQNEIENVL